MTNEKIIVLGAGGQIGRVLTKELRAIYGVDNVIGTDIKPLDTEGPSMMLNALDEKAVFQAINAHKATQIYHLVAILSASGEKNPKWAWDINMQSLFNILQSARETSVKKVFFPSSIAVFGNNIDRNFTSQMSVLQPTTVYGISKVAGENWCQYFFDKYGLDVRSLRYPGIIGHQTMPGGGTTDYAVEIYHEAIKKKKYTCFLSPKTTLPMMYMQDAIRATIELMAAPIEQIRLRTSYNLAGMSFSPEEIAIEIKKHYPNFVMEYAPDFRQKIADSWPMQIDDSAAANDWGWKPKYDLASMTADMFHHLKKKYA